MGLQKEKKSNKKKIIVFSLKLKQLKTVNGEQHSE